MIVSVFTLVFRDLPLLEALNAVKEAFEKSGTGLPPDASLWLKHQDEPVLDTSDPSSIEGIKEQYEEAGVQGRGIFFAHDYPKDDETLEEAKRKVDAAVSLGAEESLILCPWPYRGGLGKFIPPEEYYEAVLTFTRHVLPLADYAHEKGHRLSFKPHCGLVSDARSGWEFAGRYDHPAMRICYDAANVSFYEGVDPTSGLELAAPFVSSIILKDHVGGHWEAGFPDPGKGDIDHNRVMKIVRDAGFDGPVVVEKVDGESRDEKVAHLSEVLQFAKSLVESAG